MAWRSLADVDLSRARKRYLAERYPGDFDPLPPKDEIAEYLSHVERLATELLIHQT